MASIPYSDLRRGAHVVRDGQLYSVVDHELRTPGTLPSKLRIWLKSRRTGAVTDHRVHPEDRVEEAVLETRSVRFIYRTGDHFVFMDEESFDQHELPAPFVAAGANFLKENAAAELIVFNDRPVALELAATVELTVRETEPVVRGGTASVVTKPALLETGLRVTVPQFVCAGDVVVIDPRTAKYAGRVRRA
ncbi:elongation factor P [Frigoriglobus tundricola]|uniref:Translation elongation factor P n=1 Tax=Frigoriglobus tundricola TaxID=2774151 RepID=A0A6M5YFL1_9BACT|nr:elongation factor P [Frigoriglobus tundricola]QJW92768.1 Translation elongation factor P [Frigoriglobus tundricola]